QFENLSNGETATDTFTYMISDGDGGTGSAMVTITISGINDNSFNPPEGNDDFYNTDEDTAFTTGNVLSNDTDFLPPDTLTITSIDTSLTHGLVTNNNDGTFIYNPNRQFENLSNGETATDTFTYMISDGDGGTGSAMVTITISGINDNSFFDGDTIKPNNPPEGGSDTFTIQEHTSFTVNVLLNDTDPDEDDTLTVTGMNTENTLGLITNNGEGIFTYDPNHQFDGLEVGETSTDTFTYTISDNNGGIDTITVTIIITGVKKSTTGLIFNTPSTEDSFADLFTDPQKTEIHWYQLWTGDEEGSQGDFVDTSAFYGPGNGWIETSNLTSLFPDYCQYDDTALWVRSWTADGGFSAWTFSTMPFQTIDTVVACSSISCTTSIDQMFNDENASSDYWYKIWIGDTAGETTNGSFLDTSSLNNQAATGWLRASELADISIDSGIPGSSLEFWAKAWSPFAGAYEWEHWTIDCIEETADAVLMKPDEELPAIGINIQKCIEKEVLIEDFQDHHTACYQVLSQNEMENNTFTADPLAGSIDEVMFVPGFREQLETAGSIFERQRTAFLGRICSTNKKT
ncbi:MAG: tandem-95 repeat protein, partial [Desulfobacteraceae bacterium]|nr:tandem-95 repeat protein [Desulfobacteraceae bacterium]